MQAMFKSFALPLALSALSACGGSTAPPFQQDGLQQVLGSTVFSGGDSGVGGGYVYQVGLNSSSTALLAEADLLGPIELESPPTSGTATMTGPLQLRGYVTPNTATGSLAATAVSRDATLQVMVDFGAQSLSATSGTGASALQIDGVFTPAGELSGTAQYLGLSGPLTGGVGETQAIGVFEGSGTNGVFAGGFVVED